LDLPITAVRVVVSTAAEQRDERVKFILEADVIAIVKTFLTSVPPSRHSAIRLLAELVKTGTSTAADLCTNYHPQIRLW